MFVPQDQEMELHLDDYLERDDNGLPSVLNLEVPFTVKATVNNRKQDVEVAALAFRRPTAEALDILGYMAADRKNVFDYMRRFIAKVARVPDEPDIRIEARHVGTLMDASDFYRAWECSQDFLPKPKRREETPSGASEE
ncbi:MAG: hypothetical protein IH626_05370 [Rhodospirillales bacterium]|nr:hypothetical protein [Rhodospirillales bacterium]